jgi:hypothetical protein
VVQISQFRRLGILNVVYSAEQYPMKINEAGSAPSCIAREVGSITLATFATRDFREQQAYLCRSAISVGINRLVSWNESTLASEEFFRKHSYIFSQRKGFGCWLWKPYIIFFELSRIPDGHFLIYWDVGRKLYPHRFEISPQALVSWCLANNNGVLPGVYVPQYGPNRCWTKRDCFVGMNCDSVEYWEHPQVQATFSIWQKNDKSLSFVKEWLSYCERPELITDDANRLGYSNLEGFVTHRHDQSVLTNLVIKRGLRCLDAPIGSPGDKDLNNLVDRVAGRQREIERREFRKACRVRLNKTKEYDWWRRNIKWALRPDKWGREDERADAETVWWRQHKLHG